MRSQVVYGVVTAAVAVRIGQRLFASVRPPLTFGDRAFAEAERVVTKAPRVDGEVGAVEMAKEPEATGSRRNRCPSAASNAQRYRG